MIRECFSVKFGENCFCIFSCLCLFSSRRIWIFFANPGRIKKLKSQTHQKIKKFQNVLCSLKLVLIFQLDIHNICQIQYNLKTLQEADKFIENYEIETFSKFSVFQEDVGFQNKALCNTRLFGMLFSQKLKCRAEKKNYRRNVLRCFSIATEKNKPAVKYLIGQNKVGQK